MDEKVLLPFLVSIVTTLSTLFIKSMFDKSLEKHRNRQSHSNESVKALRSAITSIQSVKDVLRLILDAYKDSVLSDDVFKKNKESVNHIVEAYQEYSSYLSQEECKPFHDSKNFSINLQNNISNILKNRSFPSELDDAELTIIKEAHAKFTEYQNQLRDFIDSRIN